jgi:uncharacterized protein YcbX
MGTRPPDFSAHRDIGRLAGERQKPRFADPARAMLNPEFDQRSRFMAISLTGIHYYPVKSLRGLSPHRHAVTRLGLANDRRWMLIDADHRFVTQREHSALALVAAELRGEDLVITAPGCSPLVLPPPKDDGPGVQVTVWQDRVTALDTGDVARRWFSDYLGIPVRLVYFPDAELRQVDPAYARPGDATAFSDGFPFLLISEASLAELNRRLEVPLPMRRFRPNLVVAGCEPFAEDRWRRIRVGAIEFRVVKPCSRCAITTIDPETAERSPEPLRTLVTFRRRDKKVYFGQNLIHDGVGTLQLGDTLEVLESADT